MADMAQHLATPSQLRVVASLPDSASMPADAAAKQTWQESAGRTDGDVGYQFGDVTRTSLRCISSTLRKWSSRPKQEEGYEFGDLFLKDLVRTIVVKPEEDREVPDSDGDDDDDDESPEHRQIAASMKEKRQKALDLLERHLPRIEHRVQELEGKELNAQEASEMYRIKVGSPLSPSPLESYRKGLEDLKSSCDVRLDGCFVRLAEACGDLPRIHKCLDDTLRSAEQCARCADDVCPPLAQTKEG